MPEYKPMVWTVEPIEDMRNHISGHYLQDYDGKPHLGLDIGIPEGTPILAPGDALVVTFQNDGSFGNGVCLDFEGTRWFVLFAHCRALMVKPGDRVAAGQVIALSGNTGLSTGPHCHIQVCDTTMFPRDEARNTDPLPFVEAIGVAGPAPQPSPAPTPTPSLDEARVREIVDGAIAAQFRDLYRLYWTTQIGNDFSDAEGNELPPDPDVVRAIAAAVMGMAALAIEGGKA